MEQKKLYRSSTNRVLWGVCGGLGEYFNSDAIIVRILFIVLGLIGGSGIILYVIGIFIIPKQLTPLGQPEPVTPFYDPSQKSKLFYYLGIGLILLGLVFIMDKMSLFVFPFSFQIIRDYTQLLFWPGLLILVGILLISSYRKSQTQATDLLESIHNIGSKGVESDSSTHSRRFFRNRVDKKIFGLCGGIGTYFGIDSTLVRLIAVIIIITSGIAPGLIIYCIVSLVVPEEPVQCFSDKASAPEGDCNETKK